MGFAYGRPRVALPFRPCLSLVGGILGKARESAVVTTLYLEKDKCQYEPGLLAIWCKLRGTRLRVILVGIKRLMLKFGRCRSASRLPQCITLDSLTSTANKRTLTLGLSLTSSLLIQLYVMLYLSHAQLVRIRSVIYTRPCYLLLRQSRILATEVVLPVILNNVCLLHGHSVCARA